MAEGKVVELVDPSTKQIKRPELVGVDIEKLDPDTQQIVYGSLNSNAEADSSLSQDDLNLLHYAPRSPTSNSSVITSKLLVIGDLVETLVEKDQDIKKADSAVIQSCTSQKSGGPDVSEEETDSSEQSGFDYDAIRAHVFSIFEDFFSIEKIEQSTPSRLLINFALVMKYCYGFFKCLVEHAKDVLKSYLPDCVFKILCQVASAIFSHLVKVQWVSVIREIGGWGSVIGSVSLLRATQETLGLQMFQPRFYFGVAIVSTIMGTYFYFRN